MNEKTIHPFGDIVVRIPRLPLQVAEDLLNGDISEEKIKSYLLDKDVLEAIGSASASLKISLEKWLNGHTLPDKKQTSLLFKSMQYLIRMSSRPTPFGLMAGLTSGSWSDENVIELNGKERIASRPDMQFCRYLAGILESSEDGEKLKFFPNSSIYRVFEELRYFRSGKSGMTTKLHSIEDPGILEKLAEYCRRGKTKAEIRQFWDSCRESTFFPEDFQDELFRLRFLVPELEPNVCGQTYYTRITGFMKQDYPASCRHPKSRHLHTSLFMDHSVKTTATEISR